MSPSARVPSGQPSRTSATSSASIPERTRSAGRSRFPASRGRRTSATVPAPSGLGLYSVVECSGSTRAPTRSPGYAWAARPARWRPRAPRSGFPTTSRTRCRASTRRRGRWWPRFVSANSPRTRRSQTTAPSSCRTSAPTPSPGSTRRRTRSSTRSPSAPSRSRPLLRSATSGFRARVGPTSTGSTSAERSGLALVGEREAERLPLLGRAQRDPLEGRDGDDPFLVAAVVAVRAEGDKAGTRLGGDRAHHGARAVAQLYLHERLPPVLRSERFDTQVDAVDQVVDRPSGAGVPDLRH